MLLQLKLTTVTRNKNNFYCQTSIRALDAAGAAITSGTFTVSYTYTIDPDVDGCTDPTVPGFPRTTTGTFTNSASAISPDITFAARARRLKGCTQKLPGGSSFAGTLCQLSIVSLQHPSYDLEITTAFPGVAASTTRL